jgi:hypothetical protein
MGGAVSTYGDVAGIANIVLTVFKFVASYASLEVEITMDGDQLIRTKNYETRRKTNPHRETAHGPRKWQAINCFSSGT